MSQSAKENFVRLFTILSILVCFPTVSRTQGVSDYPKIDVQAVDTFQLKVNPKLPSYKILITTLNVTRLSKGSDEYNLYKVSVSKEAIPYPIQEFVDSSDELVEGGFFEDQDRFVDVNFDGYKDIPLEVAESNSGYNHSYHFWLYDTSLGQFRFSDAFTFMNPYINKDEQLIETSSNDGCAGKCFTSMKYKILRGLPVLIERQKGKLETDSTGAEHYVHTIERLIDGEFQTVSKEFQDSGDTNH